MLDLRYPRTDQYEGDGDVVMRSIETILSSLFVPGDRPERFAKAEASGADAIILDLEDAVAPDRKDDARANVVSHGLDQRPVIVRINARGTPWFEADCAALAQASIAAIMLAKSESAADIAVIHQIVGRQVPMVPLVETAAGVGSLSDLLSAPGVVRVAFGSFDFALDLGCTQTWEPLLHARSEIVLRSRLAGRSAPIDGITASLDDMEVVEAEARRAKEMGFGGKLAIHPRQVAAIRTGLMPNEATVAWARSVIAAADGEGGAVRASGSMIDRPVVECARRVLAAVG